jgi:hypothetical protein
MKRHTVQYFATMITSRVVDPDSMLWDPDPVFERKMYLIVFFKTEE